MFHTTRLAPWILLALPLAAQTVVPPPANSIVIKNVRNGPQRDRPFTISRMFAEGSFRNCVKAVVNGAGIPTQCDPQTRWPDGTLRHALISFRLDVHASQPVTVEFIAGEANTGGGLNAESMLAMPQLQGQMQLIGPETHTIDVRRMIQSGAYRYRLKGPICTQVIVEDRSPELQFDAGWGEHRSFHPIFVLTFYPGWSGVKVEMIGENVWADKLQDLAYQLDLSTGTALERVYSKAILHHAGTRWRKVFWSGEEPAPVTVDHNLPYLIYARALPSFDLSKKVSNDAAEAEIASFGKSDQGDIPDLQSGGRAQWTLYMPTTGGRGDIGVIPRWYVRYLYRMETPGMYSVMLGNAASSGYVPIHFREPASGRCYHGSGSGCPEAFGRPVSIQARPTYSAAVSAQQAQTSQEDRFTRVGPVRCAQAYPLCTEVYSKSPDRGQWTPQAAHLPDMAYVPYLITGDWYFLEELQFWASWLLTYGPPFETADWGRHRDWGYFNATGYDGASLEVRGKAWSFRTLVFASLASPENTPEQAYFLDKVNANIAVDEGRLNVTNGAFHEPCESGPYSARAASKWCWGRTTVEKNRANPLNFPSFNGGCQSLPSWLLDNPVRSWDRCGAPWELNFLHTVWGLAEDMGFSQIRPLRRTAAKSLLYMISAPEANPYLIAAYQMPLTKKQGRDYFATIEEIRSQFLEERSCNDGSRDQLRDKPGWPCSNEVGLRDPDHGYVFIAKAAASYLVGIDDGPLQGAAAWAWFRQHLDDRVQNDNPKWAFAPRPTYGRAAQDTPVGRGRR